MKRYSILLIICAALTLANYLMLDRQAGYAEKADRLQQEVNQLSSQVTKAHEQVRELQDSHEKLIWISQDIDQRLIQAEGRKR